MRKIRAGDGHPGVRDNIKGTSFHLFGAHARRHLHGVPGEIVAQRDGAICRATVDGAVWITHLRRADSDTERYFKLPATRALALSGSALDVPEIGIRRPCRPSRGRDVREIVYEERGGVGYLKVRLPQRGDEHRPVPAPARGLPSRAVTGHQRSSCCSAAATISPTASIST